MSNRWAQITLTEARRNLRIEDQTLIKEAVQALRTLIKDHPEVARDVIFSPYIKRACSQTDAGERRGVNTQQMLQHYDDLFGSLSDRLFGELVVVPEAEV